MRLILNPASKSGKGKKLWTLWKKGLDGNYIEYEGCETKSIEHAFELAKDSKTNVVAVGGDGTINQVLNGVVKSKHKKSMGVLYAGTSPDYCTFHNIPIDAQESLKCLMQRKEKEVDVVEIKYKNNGATEIKDYFGCSCNIGFGADIARFANKWRSIFGDTLGTGLGLIKSILLHKPFASTLDIDGEKYTFSQTNHIFIIKNPFIASGLKLNLNVKPDDGKMFAVVLHDLSRLKLFLILRHFYSGDIQENQNIFIKECKDVSVATPEKKEIEFDGDPKGFTDISIKIVSKKLSLICGE